MKYYAFHCSLVVENVAYFFEERVIFKLKQYAPTIVWCLWVPLKTSWNKSLLILPNSLTYIVQAETWFNKLKQVPAYPPKLFDIHRAGRNLIQLVFKGTQRSPAIVRAHPFKFESFFRKPNKRRPVSSHSLSPFFLCEDCVCPVRYQGSFFMWLSVQWSCWISVI